MRFVFFVVGVMSLATTGVLFPVAKGDCPLSFAADVLYGVGDGPVSITAADLDGDGDLDLATANFYSDNVSILFNRRIE